MELYGLMRLEEVGGVGTQKRLGHLFVGWFMQRIYIRAFRKDGKGASLLLFRL